MAEVKKRTRVEFLGTKYTAVKMTLESDEYEGETLDTKVTVDAGTICWIAGNQIDKFLDEIEKVIEKYAI